MNEQYTLANAVLPPSSITFFGTFPMSNTKVMEITKDGIWANPDVSVDDTAKAVLDALDGYIKKLVKEVVHQEREACAKLAEEMERIRFDSVGDPRIRVFESQIAKAIRARGER